MKLRLELHKIRQGPGTERRKQGQLEERLENIMNL